MDLKTCRICCKIEGVLFLFDNKCEATIGSKLSSCANISVVEGDGLPEYICNFCDEELSVCYQFVCKCKESDTRLRSQFKSADTYSRPNSEERKLKLEVKVETSLNDDNHYDDLEDRTDLYVNIEDLKPDEADIKLEYRDCLKINDKRSYKKRKTFNKNVCKCKVCGRDCANPSTLSIHMRTHTNEKPYPCSKCDKKYKDSGTLKRHIERNHFQEKRKRDFICEHCGKGFFSKSDVKIHMRTHTGETPYACTECPARFTQISALLRHRKRHTGEKDHICSVCAKCFCTKEELKNHLIVHSNVKKHECPLCNVFFKSQSNLKKHIRLHTEPNSFVCNYCGRTFNLKGNLKTHIDRQHSEKSGYCNICCKNVSNIEVHMWRHTGERPLKCELCTSSFYELKALARHINFRHKNVDKYKCEVEGCMLMFPSRSMLEFHTIKHHGNNIPFPCDRCSRGFYRKNDLARHKIGTHKERLAV